MCKAKGQQCRPFAFLNGYRTSGYMAAMIASAISVVVAALD